MRDIRFRIWDKEQKKMFYQHEEHPTFGNYSFDFGDVFYYHKDRFVKMQFTGLKDKNMKSIYDGDKVKYQCNSLVRIVAWHNEYSRFVLTYRSDLGDADDLKEFSLKLWSVEVIGNIYEHGSV